MYNWWGLSLVTVELLKLENVQLFIKTFFNFLTNQVEVGGQAKKKEKKKKTNMEDKVPVKKIVLLVL